jgi:thiamine-monophosphate kinase
LNLRSLGEFGLIERIAGQVADLPGVVRGIGDDAAALTPSPGQLQLVTSDMLLEGVHFDLSYTPPELLGRKSLAANLSDIAAMGGRPRWFLLSLGLPADMSLEFMDAFVGGMLGLAGEHGVQLVGGDTCASRGGLVISVTLLGEQTAGSVVCRSGARPGDLICVTGTLGDAALGLLELRAGRRDGPAVGRHLDPAPRCREGLLLAEAGLPTAMIDVSDGLMGDLGHILESSRVGARIDTGRLPCSHYFLEAAAGLTAEPADLVLSGGEDYELLFTVPPGKMEHLPSALSGTGTQVTVVGEVTEVRGLQLLAPDGSVSMPRHHGFRHF